MKEEYQRPSASQIKYGYNMSQYDLPDRYGDLPNVNDNRQQSDVTHITNSGSDKMNTFKDSTQNSNGAGRILAQ
jgi:hypothetical protein